MFLETWFVLAIISALSGGIMSFLYKVAAKEKVDIVLLFFWNSVFAVLVLACLTLVYSDFSDFWHPMVFFAALTSVTFLITNIFKVKALESIDASIFFPLYKVLGPTLVIFLGIILFDEVFTVAEWIGLGVSLCVPLLLITKKEGVRQVNLRLGLSWLLLVVAVSAISAAAWKHGSDIAPNTWMYILTVEAAALVAAIVTLIKKQDTPLQRAFTVMKEKLFLKMVLVSSITNLVSAIVFVFAFTTGGPLAIVYTINSLYILIPIVLAIIYYKEHWNLRKATAIVLSVIALAFFA